MKFQKLIVPFLSLILLSGCIGEDNPLKDVNPKILAKEIYCSQNAQNDCMDMWETPHAASTEGFVYQMCQDVASDIAIKLSKNGYGKITAKNVSSLENWAVIKSEIKILKDSEPHIGLVMRNGMKNIKTPGACD